MDLRSQLQESLGNAYVLERELGGGGMSRVFVAEETALGRKVVVKVLPPDLTAGVNVERFNREILLAAKLQQAQIVPVLAAGQMNGIPWYTMPFVDGESLRAKLAREGPLPIGEVVNVLRDITRALAYAHDHGVVHRDIKPDNVLLSGGTAVVTDFGIAKAISLARAEATDASLTQLGTSVGTPAYISPEQAAGDPNTDYRADIYSLGCVAYELLTGHPPFPGRTPQRTLAAHLTEAPKPVSDLRPDVPPALAELVTRCLEKEPSARPQSAGEIVAALDAVSSGSSTTMPALLLGGPGVIRRSLIAYGLAFAAVATVAKAAVVTFGLPDWVFTSAIVLMAIGLPVVLATAYVHHTSRKLLTRTAPLTPNGSPATQGTMAGLAMRASPFLTWRRTFRVGAITLGAFAVIVAAIMTLRLFGIGPAASLMAAGTLKGHERLLVTDFRAGGDSSLSHLVTEAVRTDLGQSSVISIMPPTAIAGALQRMQRPAMSGIDLALGRDIAQREGVKAIVDGEVTHLGAGYVVTIRLVAADSGSELAAYRKAVDGPSQLLDAVDDVTKRLRGKIGESLKQVRDAPRLEEVTTPSMEALRKYAEASRAADLEGDYAKATTLLREAVAKDTLFAMAYRKLGVVLSNTGMPAQQRDSALTRAFKYRDRLTERERFLAIGTYYQTGPGRDRVKAADAFQRVIALDPTDNVAANNLANLYRSRRQYARAESLYRSATGGGRGTQTNLGNLASVLFDQGKLAESESVTKVLRTRFPNAPGAFTLPPMFLYARGQVDSMDAYYRAHLNDANSIVRVSSTANVANLAMLHGQLVQAKTLGDETRRLNVERGAKASPFGDAPQRAYLDIWFRERHEKGVQELDSVLAKVPLRSLPAEERPYFNFASLYALGGRADKARALISQFDADVHDPTLRAESMPARHGALAEIALAEHAPLEAVREIWKADSLPDGPSGACASCVYADLGRAYDLADMPDSAIRYWERHIETPFGGKDGQDASVLAGIHKRLGELYEAKGDAARAASHYSAFLSLWKNADPELQPKVAEVKRRLARVGQPERR
jgi:tRNA A-37 threonylcarbamoyl transferase component Bud32/tetratricopeptide (TPR) repeat protein